MPIAVIALDFDPFLHLGDRAIRLETLALAGVVLLALVLAAVVAGQSRIAMSFVAFAHEPGDHLRRDDLLFIVLGIVPGAAIGGRLGYVLLHLDYYSANPSDIANPSQGGLELGFGIVFGLLTGAYVARLLEAPVGRWLHVATVPTFLAIALGKLSMILGGDGQGMAAGVAWAVSFTEPGPWGTLAAGTPAHPAQVYEAIGTGIALAITLVLGTLGGFRRGDGERFFVALILWAVVRFAVGFTWRDAEVAVGLRAGQLLAVGVAAAGVAGFYLARGRGAARTARALASTPDWPDPTTRPPF